MLATNETHTVREFVEAAFGNLVLPSVGKEKASMKRH